MNLPTSLPAPLRYAFRHPAIRLGVLAGALSLAVAAGVGTAYWWPEFKSRAALEESLNSERKRIVESMHVRRLEAAYRTARRDLKKLDAKLRTEIKQAELVENLGRLAARNRIKILSETYEEQSAKGGFRALNQELNLLGGYGALRSFMAGIRRLPTWTIVRSARLERSQKDRNMVKAKLRIATFYESTKSKASAN